MGVTECVCAHVLPGALFVQLIVPWSGSGSDTRGPTVVLRSPLSLLPSRPLLFPLHMPEPDCLSSEVPPHPLPPCCDLIMQVIARVQQKQQKSSAANHEGVTVDDRYNTVLSSTKAVYVGSWYAPPHTPPTLSDIYNGKSNRSLLFQLAKYVAHHDWSV